jgi:hypothetical protein
VSNDKTSHQTSETGRKGDDGWEKVEKPVASGSRGVEESWEDLGSNKPTNQEAGKASEKDKKRN